VRQLCSNHWFSGNAARILTEPPGINQEFTNRGRSDGAIASHHEWAVNSAKYPTVLIRENLVNLIGYHLGKLAFEWESSIHLIAPQRKINIECPNYSLTTLRTSGLMMPPPQTDNRKSCEGFEGEIQATCLD
jgi:hypothetical protein